MSSYDTLEKRFKRMSAISGASAILNWDNAVMMPDGGAASRAEQLASLGVLQHELLVDSEISDLMDQAEQEAPELSDWQQANLREMRNNWRHASAVNTDLVEALSHATSKCEMQWRSARENDNFSELQESLNEVLSLTREMADAKAEQFNLTPYDALLDQYEPGCRQEQIDVLFDDLQSFLPTFLEEVLEKQNAGKSFDALEGPFSVETQKNLGLTFMTDLGFDFERGRLDTSHHPFTGGTPDDVRLTTRYEEDDFTQSLMGTLHETGHALYEQNLPREWRSQPVGQSRGMALHESQSLVVEMQLSRSEAFLTYALPKIKEAFCGEGDNWTFDNFKRLYHHVNRGFIRVDADEVTYPLHVILRYRLEKALLSGDLQVQDLPTSWNDGMVELLGIRPPSDKLGCLQDIHWPGGAIGYFPTYTMGALAAAQFFGAAGNALPELDRQIKEGDFAPLVNWLEKNVHAFGSLKTTDQVLIDATGSALNTDAFKKHLKARYLSD
ncbi:carboxypeptidase M32 [Alphaproteobacteria bacterium 46_93_T64]|nr:carboxypeptidase M32 [Alphaproteobacteria bacterium 46_93_T64]